jgi:hypothetical protein
MLAIDIARHLKIFLFLYTGLMTLGESATRSISLQRLILALLILRGISCLYYKTYPYDTYHNCDTTPWSHLEVYLLTFL